MAPCPTSIALSSSLSSPCTSPIPRHSDLGKNRDKQVNAEKNQNLKPQRSDQSNELKNHKSDNRRNKTRNKLDDRHSNP
jgi:hypothetical protein